MLPGEAGAATKFPQSKIRGQIRVDGSRIEIEDQEGLDVKLLLHKFLHHEGLTGYRVLSESGTVRIVPDDKPGRAEPEDNKIKGVPPFPPLSTERLPLMDVVWYTQTILLIVSSFPASSRKGKTERKKAWACEIPAFAKIGNRQIARFQP